MSLSILTNGQQDPSFAPVWGNYASAVLAQPDGCLVFGNGAEVRRLLPTGAADGNFAPLLLTGSGTFAANVSGLLRYPDGRLVVYGMMSGAGSVVSAGACRLLPNGTPDPSFVSTLNVPNTSNVGTAALQPNHRLLVAGNVTPTGQPFARLLPDGRFDVAANLATDDITDCIRVQANGGILLGGRFRQVGGQPHMGLVRLLAPNVLATRLAATGPALEVWPVPAHDQLNLTCDPADRAQRATLRDALGRTVQTLNLTQPTQAIGTAGLAPGIYHLRVEYAGAQVAIRRIVLE